MYDIDPIGGIGLTRSALIIRKTEEEVRAAANARLAEINVALTERQGRLRAMLDAESLDISLDKIFLDLRQIVVGRSRGVRLSPALRAFANVALTVRTEEKIRSFFALIAAHIRGPQEMSPLEASRLFNPYDPREITENTPPWHDEPGEIIGVPIGGEDMIGMGMGRRQQPLEEIGLREALGIDRKI